MPAMAEIPKFEGKAGRPGMIEVDTDTGSVETWLGLARASSRLASKVGDIADRAAAKEGELEGLIAGSNVQLPDPELPPDQQTAAATPPRDDRAPAKPIAGDARAKAISYYVKQGWTREQAAGIVGNLIEESRLNPQARNPNDAGPGLHSEGLGQWNRERLARLKQFGGAKWQDFDVQLAFVQHELTTTEAAAGARLKSSRTVADATAAMIGYERPQGWTSEKPQGGMGWANRLAHAESLFGEIGTASPSVAAPAVSPLRIAPASDDPPATIQPLILSRGFSIRDQAFDRAALGAAADRLDVQAYQNLEAIAARYPDQPEQALEAIEAYKTATLAALPEPELSTRFQGIVARHRVAILKDAAEKSEANRKDARQAAFLENWNARRTAAVRLARRIGGGDITTTETVNGKPVTKTVNGDDMVAAELADMEGLLASAQDLKPTERAKFKIELAQDVGTARVLGAFERLKTPTERQAYAAAFEEAWTKGDAKELDLMPETFEAIRRDMQQQITRDQVEAERTSRETGQKVDAVIKRLTNGYAVTAEERAAIKAQVEASADPAVAKNFQFFDALANWQAGARQARPETIAAAIATEEARMTREGATDLDIDALKAMKDLHKTIDEGVKKDPLSLGERMGILAVPALNPQDFVGSLRDRKVRAETIGRHYGRAPMYFKAGEVEALTRAFAQNPDQIVTFAGALQEAFGDADAADALDEISKDAPLIAHAAGAALATGSDRLVREMAEAQKRKAIEGYKPVQYPEAPRRLAIAETFGPALSQMPETYASALQMADTLFDMRAQAQGLDPAAKPAEARLLYDAALQDALGSEGGTGGVGDINGIMTVVPPGRTASDIEMSLQSLTDDDLAQLPPIGNPTGVPVKARDLRNAKLVAVGIGRYRVALGDPRSDSPRYVAMPAGGFWELDLATLDRITRGRQLPIGASPFGEFEMQR